MVLRHNSCNTNDDGHTMNPTSRVFPSSNPLSNDLPSSGLLVHCRQEPDLPPKFAIPYGSYQQVLGAIVSLFTAEELWLLLWKRECYCGDCKFCEAWDWHQEMHVNEITMQVRVLMPGWIKFDQLDTYANNDWSIRDIYRAAHYRLYGNYPRVTDQQAYKILWNGKVFVEQFDTFNSKF